MNKTAYIYIFSITSRSEDVYEQICSGLNTYEMHALYCTHHKVSSMIKGHPDTQNSVKYKVI